MSKIAATARLYLTDGQIADADRPVAKRTISYRLFDENGKAVRGFQPTKSNRAKVTFGGDLEGVTATVKSSGSFSQEEMDLKHRGLFPKLYEQLAEADASGQRGYADVPVEIEMLAAAADARKLKLELGL